MDTLSDILDDGTLNELKKIAMQNGCSVNDCVLSAVREYIANYQDDYSMQPAAMNNLERSFFFSAGE